VITTQQCWDLAKRWYRGRAEMDWVRRPAEEAEQIFGEVGLEGPFWALRDRSLPGDL
jgi:hypothetical protein